MKRERTFLSVLVLTVLALGACAPMAAQPTVAPTATPEPQLPLATGTASPAPSATPTSTAEARVTRVPDESETPEYRGLGPLPADERMNRGAAFVYTTEVLLLESMPVQAQLHITGALPTPCNQLRTRVAEPDAQNRIMVEVYSVVDPNVACIQVLAEFDETLSLGTFAAGKYEVWVNGELAGEFTVQA